jgi:glycosyltransferase involved in cell wall biosynthesis
VSESGPPPRVLFVCGSDFSSPSEKQVLWFCLELTSRGSEAMISLMGNPATARAEGADRVNGLRLLWPRFRGRSPSDHDLQAVREFEPDLIHAFNVRVPVVAAAGAYSEATGAPVFVHWEDDEWGLRKGLPTRSPIKRAVRLSRRIASLAHPPLWYLATPGSIRWAARNATAHDALAPALASYVEKRLERRCELILPAMAPPRRDERVEPPPMPDEVHAGRIAAYTGEIHPARVDDVRLAARAVAIAQQRGENATFVHAGGNVAGVDTERLAADEGLRPGSYAFLGHLPYARIPPLLEESAALIASSRPIRFNIMCLPSKLQGYLASGTPVLASAAGAGELLRDREEVLKTSTAEPEELADRLCEVLTDDDLARTLAAGGPRAAKRLFDPVRNTDSLLAHYRRSLTESPHRTLIPAAGRAS